MADINVKYGNSVSPSTYKARYSKEYARREMETQKRVEDNHVKQLKAWRKQAMKENVAPF